MTKILIYFSFHHKWEDRWHFYQSLALGLSKYFKIIYINPPINILRMNKAVVAQFIGTKTTQYKNLEVYTPIFLPFRHIEPFQYLNSRVLFYQIKNLVKNYKQTDVIFWTYSPDFCQYTMKKIKSSKRIYWTADEVIIKREYKLLELVDYIFTASEPVFEEKKRVYPNKTFFIPTGCEFELLNSVLHKSTEIPSDMKSIPKPIIGYGGAISSRIDFDLVYYLAKSNPNYSFVFVGPFIGDCPYFSWKNGTVPNIYFLGHKEREQVPLYLKYFDVTIIPYNTDNFNMRSNPNKFYDYCALGKPVITTYIPTLEKFSNICYLTKTKEDFDDILKKVVNNLQKDDKIIENRIEIARKNSIEFITRDIINIIKK